MLSGPQSVAPDIVCWWGSRLLYFQVEYSLNTRLTASVVATELAKVYAIDSQIAGTFPRVVLLVGQFPTAEDYRAPLSALSDASATAAMGAKAMKTIVEPEPELIRAVVPALCVHAISFLVNNKKKRFVGMESGKVNNKRVIGADVLKWLNDGQVFLGQILNDNCTLLTVGAHLASDTCSAYVHIRQTPAASAPEQSMFERSGA